MPVKLTRIIEDFFLAIAAFCGPGIWLAVLGFVYEAAWGLDYDGTTELGYLWFSFLFAVWAIWGIVYGPSRLPAWWFGLASFFNMLSGVGIVNNWPVYPIPIGMLFLGYSCWQFFVLRRPIPKRLIP